MKEVNRRDVLRAASGAAALTAAQYSRVMGANERVKLGVIGCGGRGTFVMNVFKNNPVDIVAFCDVWETRAERARATAGASARANIAYVQKRRIKFDPLREEILPL